MDLLKRALAPITEAAWSEIDDQAKEVLSGNLTARRLVDFNGPEGWDASAVNLGQIDMKTKEAVKGVEWGMRLVLPLCEIRVPFTLNIWDIDNIARGSKTADLDAVVSAAQKAALFEEQAVFSGLDEACINGIIPGSPHKPVQLPASAEGMAAAVESAVVAIEKAAIGGPYALVLGTDAYQKLMTGDQRGYPLKKRVEDLIRGDICWSPAVKGGVLMSAAVISR